MVLTSFAVGRFRADAGVCDGCLPTFDGRVDSVRPFAENRGRSFEPLGYRVVGSSSRTMARCAVSLVVPQEILVSLHRGATCASRQGTSHA